MKFRECTNCGESGLIDTETKKWWCPLCYSEFRKASEKEIERWKDVEVTFY